MPNSVDVRITTIVVAHTSRRVGHVTRPSSLRTSARNRRARPNQPTTCSGDSLRLSSIAVFTNPLRGLRLAGPHWSQTLAGQEGLEPPALGFGDRCSTN